VLAQLDAVKPGNPDLAPSSYEDRPVLLERASCAIPANPVPEPTAWQRKMSAEGRHRTWVNAEAYRGWLRETTAIPGAIDPIVTVFDPAAVREFAARNLGAFTNSTDIRHVYRSRRRCSDSAIKSWGTATHVARRDSHRRPTSAAP